MIFLGILVLFGVLFWGVYQWSAGLMMRRGLEALEVDHGPAPPREVLTGSPLAWRRIEFHTEGSVLSRATIPPFLLELATGDFDGDRSDELFVQASTLGSWLVELDGSRQKAGQWEYQAPVHVSWDCDGDGTADLLVNEIGDGSQSVRLVSPDGNSLAVIDGVVFGKHSAATADLDGDGFDELALMHVDSSDKFPVRILGTGLEDFMPLLENCRFPCFGDSDGDGAAEVITLDLWDGGGFTCLKPDGTSRMLPGWDDKTLPSGCADVNGDGFDEVFAAKQGYMDLATGVFTVFAYPPGTGADTTGWWDHVVVLDLDGDGTVELVTVDGSGGSDTAVLAFTPDGECVYYEEVGALIEMIAAAQDDSGREYLIVKTMDELLIYP